MFAPDTNEGGVFKLCFFDQATGQATGVIPSGSCSTPSLRSQSMDFWIPLDLEAELDKLSNHVKGSRDQLALRFTTVALNSTAAKRYHPQMGLYTDPT